MSDFGEMAQGFGSQADAIRDLRHLQVAHDQGRHLVEALDIAKLLTTDLQRLQEAAAYQRIPGA